MAPVTGAEQEGLGIAIGPAPNAMDSTRVAHPASNVESTVGAFHFVAFGTPKAAGSKRGFVLPGTKRVIITDDNPKSRPWKNQVAQAAGLAMDGRQLFNGPLSVEMRFMVARPKGHFGKNGLNATGRASPYPAKKPDALKLARGVEDAMSGVVYRDDAQIVHEVLTKEYGEPERVEVTMTELDGSPVLPPSRHYAVGF